MSRDASVQVLAKAGALLDRLAEQREAPAATLADLIQEPRSSVYRLLATLQQLGLVEPGSKRGTYRLGLKLFQLGSAVLARFDERQGALPVMERLHEETGETVFLCIRRGNDAVCIERLDGRRVQSLALRLGGTLPLHSGAAPRVLLAFEPRERWEEYLAGGELQAFTPMTPVAREELLEQLEEIRSVGYAISDEDVTVGIAAIGAPIFDYRGSVRAALSISGVKPAILGEYEAAMVELVVNGALEVSRSLGYVERETAVGNG